MYCRKCGAQNRDDASFCFHCGAPLHSNSDNSQNTNQSSPAQPAAAWNVPVRSIPLCIVLSIVTCGIYGIYWFVCLANDLNAVAEEPNGTSGGMAFLFSIVTCGIYALYWMYKAGTQIAKAKSLRGLSADNSAGILYLILSLIGFGIISYALIQNELNNIAEYR